MSSKPTRHITREEALEILRADIEQVSDSVLTLLLSTLASTHQSRRLTCHEQYVVTDAPPPPPPAFDYQPSSKPYYATW